MGNLTPMKDIARQATPARRVVDSVPPNAQPPALPEPKRAVGPVCPSCKGARWLRYDVPYGHPKFGKITQCPCATGLKTNEVPTDIYTWLNDNPGDLPTKLLSTFKRAKQPYAYDETEKWLAKALKNVPQMGNLIYIGDPGTGKTHLCASVVNVLTQAGIACKFMRIRSFFKTLYASDFEKQGNLVSSAQSIPVLVIDDLDKITGTKPQQDTLYDILDARYLAHKPTLLTTNADGSLDTWLNKAAQSRLVGRGTLIPMNGADYRLEGGTR